MNLFLCLLLLSLTFNPEDVDCFITFSNTSSLSYVCFQLFFSLLQVIYIFNTRDSVSSGYPNAEKRVENTCMTHSVVFLTKF